VIQSTLLATKPYTRQVTNVKDPDEIRKKKKSKKLHKPPAEADLDVEPKKKKKKDRLEKLARMARKGKPMNSEQRLEYRVGLAKLSPNNGVRFPEGTKKIVFEHYRKCLGNIQATRRSLQESKALEGGRVPTAMTLKKWVDDENWELTAAMVDEGIMDVLNFKDDPMMKEFVEQEAVYFKVLNRISSSLLQGMTKKGNPLYPKNNKDAVATLRLFSPEIARLQELANKKNARGDVPATAESNGDEPPSTRPLTIAEYLAKKQKEPVTEEDIAREIIRRKQASEG